MNTIKITCPECKHQMEYWTRNNFINCTKCKASIPVEPCIEELEEVINVEIEANGDIEIYPEEPAK